MVSVDAMPFELAELTVPQLQQLLQSGTYTSVQMTQLYLQRIADIDTGLQIHSVLHVNTELALKQAAECDRQRAAGEGRSQLHGIPILLKDNISTVDMPTTCGSTALAAHYPSKDAHLVTLLRQAGCVILGKANLSQWSYARSTRGLSGWSSVGGQCVNPYCLDRSCSGSSNGSAAAVAANLAPISIGTDTGGSITLPASMCCTVGLRPTTGLISRAGIIPISSTKDTAGPLTRTVTDCAILLNVIAGSDASDQATAEADKRKAQDYTKHLNADSLQGKRIGVLHQLAKPRYHVQQAFDAALQELRDAGATLIDDLHYWSDDDAAVRVKEAQLDAAIDEVMLTDYKYDLPAHFHEYDANHTASISSIEELIAYNTKHADVELAVFGQELLEQSVLKGSREDAKYIEAKQRMFRLSRQDGIDALLQKHNLDALVTPTGATPWVVDRYADDHYQFISTTMCAAAGYPQITVPCGLAADGALPMGLSFMASPWQEGLLLELAYAYEQRTKHRQAPKFIPTLSMRT